jgi:hypothetical protein
MLCGMQLTAIAGPFWLDGERLVFGTLADAGASNRAPRPITARTLGGLAALDGELALGDEHTFDVHGTLLNADLAQIAQQIAPHQQQLSGRMAGRVHMGGLLEAKHTWHGEGQMSFRDADIYELPAMITLLKLLSIQPPNRTAFTNSDIDFRIEGDDLVFGRIDFAGDAISLKGTGRMTGQGQLDLKFYPLVGREERHLPIFRPILGETGREFMLIEVTGTLDHPDIRRTPFPRLDASLAQLFPELIRPAPPESNFPRLPSPREALDRLRPLPLR